MTRFFNFLLITILFQVKFSIAQNPGEWVWLKGDSTTSGLGNFGVQGVPSPTNEPPHLYEPCEWKGKDGSLWLFGGGREAALWKYEPGTNDWTWMRGPDTSDFLGNYGVKGISSPTNDPPFKNFAAASWVDTSGNFWMFGGAGNSLDEYSDLWMYNPAINEWTWMKGPNIVNQPGVYGIQGVPDSLNNPPYRRETASTWVDNDNNLWLFGGWDVTTVASYGHNYNDLWKYNISTNNWTWMKGSSSYNQSGIYGTLGIEDSLNTPGGRMSWSHWKDNSGNFWLYGGYFRNYLMAKIFSDLWKYNPATNNWTWVAGSNSSNRSAFFLDKCDNSLLERQPGNRMEHRACWNDVNGNFFLFGGQYTQSSNNYSRNDIWKYCVDINRWIYVDGDSVANPNGVWGTQGQSSPNNKPNRRNGCVSWTDSVGDIYLFGGYGNYNDLWKYKIDTNCVSCRLLPVSNLNASANSICPGACVDFINLSENATHYQWLFPGSNTTLSTDTNPSGICYNNAGSYDVTLIAYDTSGSDTLTLANFITVSAVQPQSIYQDGNTLIADSGFTSYQWYHNGVLINGATNYTYLAYQNGDYNIIATNINGCEVEAVIYDVHIGIDEFDYSKWIFLSPNPVLSILKIESDKLDLKAAEILNIFGATLQMDKFFQSNSQLIIDVRDLPEGIYFVRFLTDKGFVKKRFVKA